MLAIWGMPAAEVEACVGRVNKAAVLLPDASSRTMHIGLRNGNSEGVVVCGHPDSLHTLVELLHKTQAPLNPDGTSRVDQSRIPFSKRKREPRLTYLSVSLPFHTPLVAAAKEKALADLEQHGLLLDASKLQFPVLSTYDGSNQKDTFAKASPIDFTAAVLQQICIDPVNWPLNNHQLLRTYKVTHIIDFGPGRGVAGISAKNLEGAGVQIVSANSDEPNPKGYVSKWSLFDARSEGMFHFSLLRALLTRCRS